MTPKEFDDLKPGDCLKSNWAGDVYFLIVKEKTELPFQHQDFGSKNQYFCWWFSSNKHLDPSETVPVYNPKAFDLLYSA